MEGETVQTGTFDDSLLCDEIECYPKSNDGSDDLDSAFGSFRQLEKQMLSTIATEMESQKSVAEQKYQVIHEHDRKMIQKQYENQSVVLKSILDHMIQVQKKETLKRNIEIQVLREHLMSSDDKWNEKLASMEQLLLKQQEQHHQEIQTLQNQIKDERANNQSFFQEARIASEDFRRARMELSAMISTNEQHFFALEEKLKQQSQEMQSFRNDLSAEKDDMELMVQSWIMQHEALSHQVQELSSDLSSTKNMVQDAATCHSNLETVVSKMGQTFETVCEHMAEQMQEHYDEHNVKHDNGINQYRELSNDLEKTKAHFHETVQYIQTGTIQPQQDAIVSLQKSFENLDPSIAALKQDMNAVNVEMLQVQRNIREQQKVQVMSQQDMVELKCIVAGLEEGCSHRLLGLETSMDQDRQTVVETRNLLQTELDNSTARVKAVDSKIVIHSIQLGEISKDLKDVTNHLSTLQISHDEATKTFQESSIKLSEQFDEALNEHKKSNDEFYHIVQGLSATTNGIQMHSKQLENSIDALASQLEQFDDDHTKNHGNLILKHAMTESTLTEQLQNLKKQIELLEGLTSHQIEDCQGKMDHQLDQKFQQVIAEQKSLKVEMQSCLESDLTSMRKAFEAGDELLMGQLKEYHMNAQKDLKCVAEGLSKQNNSQALLRARILEFENRTKERYDKSISLLVDQFDQSQKNADELKECIDELTRSQEDTQNFVTGIDKNMTKVIGDVSSLKGTLATEISGISDSLKTAKDARFVMRSDLKKLVAMMNHQYDQLQRRIGEQSIVSKNESSRELTSNEPNEQKLEDLSIPNDPCSQ
jgi:chromosome segregation ATPase